MSDDDKVVRLPVAHISHDRSLQCVPYKPGTCQHLGVTYFYSAAESEVTCGGCSARLNPVWVIGQMAQQESQWIEGRKVYLRLKEEHESRKRCKCQHCGRLTRIRGM